MPREPYLVPVAGICESVEKVGWADTVWASLGHRGYVEGEAGKVLGECFADLFIVGIDLVTSRQLGLLRTKAFGAKSLSRAGSSGIGVQLKSREGAHCEDDERDDEN